MKERPTGFVCIVTAIPLLVKFAVSVIGLFIVTEAGLFVPVYEPVPLPVQPLNVNPPFGVAEMLTTCPALKNPLGGLTVPPAPALIVN